MSIYQTIVRNTYWSALSTVGGLAIGMITNIVLARALGAQVLGQYNYWLWLIGLLALIASPRPSPGNDEIRSRIPRPGKREKLLRQFSRD